MVVSISDLENKIGTENQVHTNPMYYNKAIPKSGYKAPARIEFCKNTAEKIMQGFFDIKDELVFFVFNIVIKVF